jgi:hypothetical protein
MARERSATILHLHGSQTAGTTLPGLLFLQRGEVIRSSSSSSSSCRRSSSSSSPRRGGGGGGDAMVAGGTFAYLSCRPGLWWPFGVIYSTPAVSIL